MGKARHGLTDSELLAYSNEHVLYEISMLVQCGQLLTHRLVSVSPALATIIRNAIVESFAIHVRNLVDFLYPGTNVKPTDVIADDFFDLGKRPPNFPAIAPSLEAARKRAHKQVSHLTTGRLAEGHPGKSWPLGLVVDTLTILREFSAQAAPTKLNRSIPDFINTALGTG